MFGRNIEMKIVKNEKPAPKATNLEPMDMETYLALRKEIAGEYMRMGLVVVGMAAASTLLNAFGQIAVNSAQPKNN